MTPRPMKTRKPVRKQQPTSPSLTSLISSITKASSNSSGSNSTVTPESYAKQHRSSRNGQGNAAPSRLQKLPTQQPTPQPTPPESPVGSRPDVFAYMEDGDDDSEEELHHVGPEEEMEDEEDEGASDEDDEDHEEYEEHQAVHSDFGSSDPTTTRQSPRSPPQMAQFPSTPRSRPLSGSFNSDSGISIRSSSPEQDSPPQQRKPISNRPPRLRQFDLDSSPESFYIRPSRSVPQTATFASQQPTFPPPQSLLPFQRSSPPATLTARPQQQPHPASIASKISATSQSSTSIRPIYRRFEALTNTLLLQLQSELQRLETDLAQLDATLYPSDHPADSKSRRSRRQDLLPQQRDQLEWQRAELFGLLGAKLEQYHRTLTSYHALTKMSSPGTEEIEKLKALMRTEPHEPSFLARLEDLATLSAPSDSTIQHSTELALRSAHGSGNGNVRLDDRQTALFAGGAVLMTILAFKFVPSLVARVVLGAVVVAAMVGCGLLPELEKERWRKQVGVYAGAVVALATIVG
ncbi:MAG: hypothetical protein MMC23_006274 [Stictis urceolatum]|nr:hypothetical protein [Stictis urceolata]